MYTIRGISSNFLVYDGRVLFTQGDGTLTLLDLETGKVLKRGTEQWHIDHFRNTRYGILAIGSGSAYMLDRDSLKPKWESQCGSSRCLSDELLLSGVGDGAVECRQLRDGMLAWSCKLGKGEVRVFEDAGKVVLLDRGQSGQVQCRQLNDGKLIWSALLGPYPELDLVRNRQNIPFVILHNEDGRVECRRFADGELVWSYKMDPRVSVVTVGDRVLLSSSPPNKEAPSISLLDLASGKELLQRTLPCYTLWHAYLDDSHIYYLHVGAPQVHDPSTQPAASTAPESQSTLLVWDLAGNLIDSVNDSRFLWGSFTLGDKAFSDDGHVGPALGTVKTTDDGLGPDRPELPTGMSVFLLRHEQPEKPTVMSVRVERKGGGWWGVIPHSRFAGRWNCTDSRLLLGGSSGYVECLDATTGKSLWIYASATVLDLISYSSPNGLPSRMTELARRYEEEINRPDPIGLCLLPDSKTPDQVDIARLMADPSAVQRPPVVHDPSPVDLFPELPGYLRIVWTLVLTPLVIWSGLMAARIKFRRLGFFSASLMHLLTAAALFAALYWYCRISDTCTNLAKVAILLMSLLTLYHTIRLWRRRSRVLAAVVLVAIAVLGYYAMPVLMYG